MRVSLAPDAERDLVEGGLHYSREANDELGHAFFSEFDRSAALLGEQPTLGAPWREALRRFPLRRFPYSRIYYLRHDSVRILAVAHQSRKPDFGGIASNIRGLQPKKSRQLSTQSTAVCWVPFVADGCSDGN